MNWFNQILAAVRSMSQQLKRIADVLEEMKIDQDFSEEDKTVLGITQSVKEAQERIPKAG